MHIQISNLKPPIPSLLYPQNPRLITFPSFLPISSTASRPVFSSHKALVSAPNRPAGPIQDCNLKAPAVKTIDIATLGNLCLDIVLNVPQLPPSSRHARKAYMDRLASSPPDTVLSFSLSLYRLLIGGECTILVFDLFGIFSCSDSGRLVETAT